jgi:NAD(P)-dependent dehydrogenase (short-subunit alcohol dehydrogenase family)
VLEGKTVLITGSSTGIGREAAYRFAGEKAELIITYCRGEEEGRITARKCGDLGSPRVHLKHLDITDEGSIDELAGYTAGQCGGIDILINNAGVATWKQLQDQSCEDIDRQISVNLTGLIKMTRAVLPQLRDMIINISSGSGKKGFPELTTYCATKFGVRGFTKALATETDIKTVSVNPPLTATRMTGYEGMPAAGVAEVVLDAAKRRDSIETGSDIDITARA